MTEEQIVQSVTDKLIEVAKHPEMRKEFHVVVENRIFNCYRNDPMMCDIDRYVLATFYAYNIELYAKSEDDCREFYQRSKHYIDEMADFIDICRTGVFLNNITARFYAKKEDYLRAFHYKSYAFIYSRKTPEGANREDLNKLKDLANKAGEKDYELFLCEIEDYFEEFEKKLNSESDPGQEWEEFARKAIEDIRGIAITYFSDEGEELDADKIEGWTAPILQAYEIIEPPKRKTSRKGEFDFFYNKAEKGDPEAQRIIAGCYREGDVVAKNERLANFWQAIADEHRFIE